MPKSPGYPDERQIRAALIERSKEFARITGMSLGAIGEAALKDSKFLYLLTTEPKKNFKLSTYTRLMKWLDKQWPQGDIVPPASGNGRSTNRARN